MNSNVGTHGNSNSNQTGRLPENADLIGRESAKSETHPFKRPVDESQSNRTLLDRLRALFEVERELSGSETLDDLCRRAIELGRSRLGFDRLGLWFFIDDFKQMRGSFGTDEHGNLRDERHQIIAHGFNANTSPFLEYRQPLVFHEEAQLNDDRFHQVSTGSLAMAALWDGSQVLGLLCTDNLLQRQPITEDQRELLVLYAASVGNLYKHKQAEESLRESESRNRAMVSAQPDLMFVINRRGDYLDCHGPSPADFLVTPDQFLGKNMRDVLPPDLALQSQAAIDRAFGTGEIQFLDYALTMNGKRRWYEARIVAFDDDRVLAISRDITEAKRQADLIEETGTAAQVGGWELDVRTNDLYWTAETYRIHETTPEEYSPSADSVRRFYSPETMLFIGQTYRECLASGEGFDIELEMTTAKGNKVWVRTIGRVQYEEGAPVRIYGALQDITERNRLREELLQAQKMESIGRLAGGIAHDFNNLLTAILGYTELASTEVAPGSAAEQHLKQVQSAGERAASLTSQLLAFARRQIINPQVTNLNDLILDVGVILRRLIAEDIELITRCEPDLGLVKLDEGQFQQILINLVVNARDAMPDGGKLTIETGNVSLTADAVRHLPGLSPGQYVTLTVADTGSGIDEAVQQHLFEPFFTTKGPGKGTGLGLATCHGIVKQNGGHISVMSRTGKGTSFRILLPRVSDPSPDRRDSPVTPPPKGTETLLVVEDDHSLCDFVVTTLESSGYSVLRASNGQEALALVAAYDGRIQLLITDVIMPQMDGITLAGELRSLRPDSRALFISGYTEDRFIRRGIIEAEVHFLQKPFSTDALLRKVRQAIDNPPPLLGAYPMNSGVSN